MLTRKYFEVNSLQAGPGWWRVRHQLVRPSIDWSWLLPWLWFMVMVYGYGLWLWFMVMVYGLWLISIN